MPAEKSKKEKEEEFIKIKIEKYETENEKLYKELESLAYILKEHEIRQQELDSIELQTDPKDMQRVVANKEREVFELKYQIEKLTQEKNSLFKHLQEVKADENRFNDKAERIYNENEKMKEEIYNKNDKIQELSHFNEEDRREINERKEVITQLKSDISAAKLINLQNAQATAETNGKIETLQKKLEKSKFMKGNLTSEFDNLREMSNKMKIQYVEY